jgi:hypothetical protein
MIGEREIHAYHAVLTEIQTLDVEQPRHARAKRDKEKCPWASGADGSGS